MATITKPITVTAVKNSLGVGSTDVGTLCTHANVRQWARFKPMDMPKLFYTRDSTSDFWKGKASISGQYVINGSPDIYMVTVCGLKFYVFSDLEECVYRLVDSKDGSGLLSDNYSWDKPKGGTSSPYRLADFYQYDNTAGCQFWTDITDTPTTRRKYNLQSGEPISCTLTSFNIGGGHQGLSINDLLDCMGATNRNLIAVKWIENESAYDYTSTEVASVALSRDYDTTLSFNPSGKFSISSRTQYVIYMVKFSAPANDGSHTFYMPLTQHFNGGNNTMVRMFKPSGEIRYAVRGYKFVENPPVTMNLAAVKWQYRSGSWTTNWINAANLHDWSIETNNLWFKIEATNMTNNAFVFSKGNVTIKFDYRDSQGNFGTHELKGSMAGRILASKTETWTRDDATITVQSGKINDIIYMSLPGAFNATTEGKNLSGATVYHMTITYHGVSGGETFNLGSFNLNLKVT